MTKLSNQEINFVKDSMQSLKLKEKLTNKKYPICPECGCNTLVGFTPPKDGIIGTIDWQRSHLYCCNGETNCKYNTKFIDLTTPLTEQKYYFTTPTYDQTNLAAGSRKRV